MPPSDSPAEELVGSPAAALDLALVRGQLKIGRLGAQLHYFTELNSTNTRARELADAGASEGEIVLAESQTQGRGRLGRRWESPGFRNLYLSIILRPNLAPALTRQITLMAAVAVAETVGFFIGRPPEIKWPNDILADGKKLAGILAEAACDAKRVEYVVLGIGLNVDYRAETMPEELRPRATSVAVFWSSELPRKSLPGPMQAQTLPIASPFFSAAARTFAGSICSSASTGISTVSKPHFLNFGKSFTLSVVNGLV